MNVSARRSGGGPGGGAHGPGIRAAGPCADPPSRPGCLARGRAGQKADVDVIVVVGHREGARVARGAVEIHSEMICRAATSSGSISSSRTAFRCGSPGPCGRSRSPRRGARRPRRGRRCGPRRCPGGEDRVAGDEAGHADRAEAGLEQAQRHRMRGSTGATRCRCGRPVITCRGRPGWTPRGRTARRAGRRGGHEADGVVVLGEGGGALPGLVRAEQAGERRLRARAGTRRRGRRGRGAGRRASTGRRWAPTSRRRGRCDTGGGGEHRPAHALAEGHRAQGLGLLGREQPRVGQRRRRRGGRHVGAQAGDVPAAEGRRAAVAPPVGPSSVEGSPAARPLPTVSLRLSE